MARYAALGKNATTVASELEIPATIATHAIARKMMGADPMTKLTKGWYESVYSRSSREIDLTALKLKPTGNSLMQNLHKRFHNRYAAGLPEEKDAWDCERLLEPVYNWP